MANFKKHLVTGAIIGTITAIVLYLIQYFKEHTKESRLSFWLLEIHSGSSCRLCFGSTDGNCYR